MERYILEKDGKYLAGEMSQGIIGMVDDREAEDLVLMSKSELDENKGMSFYDEFSDSGVEEVDFDDLKPIKVI